MSTEKDWWERCKDVAQIAGVIILLVYTCYTIKMYHANKQAADAATSAARTAADSLSEIEKGSSDTHALAVAADEQADAAKAQAENTQLIAKAAQAEIAASVRSAEAAKDSADTAAKELEFSERPWVDADITINGPLTFNVNGVNLNVLIRLRNTGHSPAFNTEVSPRLVPVFGGPDPFQLRNQVCQDAVKSVSSYGFGISLFPNSDFQTSESIGLGNQEIEKAQESFNGHLRGRLVGLTLVACVAYRPTFDNTSVYTTGYVMDVIEIDKDTNLPGINFPIGQDIDADHLRLQLGPGAIVAN